MRNLARFRLCAVPTCIKGAVIPKNRTKPNGWTVNPRGALLCPGHSRTRDANPALARYLDSLTA